VDGVRKIDRRSPARQREDFALRREDIDGIREEVDLDVFEKLARVARLALDIEQGLQPLMGAFPADRSCYVFF